MIAFVVFCLGYGFAFAKLILGSLTMHGPTPLRNWALWGPSAGTLLTIAGPWILWVATGLLSSLLIDVKTLAGQHQIVFLLATTIMLVATFLFLILPAKFLRLGLQEQD